MNSISEIWSADIAVKITDKKTGKSVDRLFVGQTVIRIKIDNEYLPSENIMHEFQSWRRILRTARIGKNSEVVLDKIIYKDCLGISNIDYHARSRHLYK